MDTPTTEGTTEATTEVPAPTPAPAPAPGKKPSSGLAIAGMVLGIVAILLSFLPIINNLSFFLAIVGLILSIVGLVKANKGTGAGKGMAIAGIVLCVVAFAAVLGSQSVYKNALDKATDQVTNGSAVTSTSTGQSTSGQDSSSSKSDAKSESQDHQGLAVGTTVSLENGLSVTVDEVETGLTKYDGSEVVRVHVTYANSGSKNESFNAFDWKAEDAGGAQRSYTYYNNATDELNSGQVSAGGTASGNVYFDAPIAKVHYYNSMISKTSTASWAV